MITDCGPHQGCLTAGAVIIDSAAAPLQLSVRSAAYFARLLPGGGPFSTEVHGGSDQQDVEATHPCQVSAW